MFQPLFGPIRQWGFVVKDLETAMANWVEQLGVGPWTAYRNVPMKAVMNGVTTDIVINVGLSYQNGVQIELIHQLNDAESPYRAFYRTEHAQQLHQLAYMVPDIDAAIAQGQRAGLRECGRVITFSGQPYVYLDSPAMAGLVLELMPPDPAFAAQCEAGSAEAANWDGRNPVRWITL